MMSAPACARKSRIAVSVSTLVNAQTRPAVSRRSPISSASVGSSSIERIRNGLCMSLPNAARRRLVDERPENAQFLDGIYKLMKIDRLHNIGIHAEFVAGHQVFFFSRRGQNDHRNQSELGVGLDFLQDLQAIYFGKFQIQENHGRIVASATLE